MNMNKHSLTKIVHLDNPLSDSLQGNKMIKKMYYATVSETNKLTY